MTTATIFIVVCTLLIAYAVLPWRGTVERRWAYRRDMRRIKRWRRERLRVDAGNRWRR